MKANDNHPPTMQLDIASIPITIRRKPTDDEQTAAQERIEHEARTMRYGARAIAGQRQDDCAATPRPRRDDHPSPPGIGRTWVVKPCRGGMTA
jgi:hypothetical protein